MTVSAGVAAHLRLLRCRGTLALVAVGALGFTAMAALGLAATSSQPAAGAELALVSTGLVAVVAGAASGSAEGVPGLRAQHLVLQPDRPRSVQVQLAAGALVGAVVAVVGGATAAVAAVLLRAFDRWPGSVDAALLAGAVGRSIAAYAALAAIGAAVALALRSFVGALVVLLVALPVAEGLIATRDEALVELLPVGAASALVDGQAGPGAAVALVVAVAVVWLGADQRARREDL